MQVFPVHNSKRPTFLQEHNPLPNDITLYQQSSSPETAANIIANISYAEAASLAIQLMQILANQIKES